MIVSASAGGSQPAALGEVWLTHSQEQSIQRASELRRLEVEAGAMCPPITGASEEAISRREACVAEKIDSVDSSEAESTAPSPEQDSSDDGEESGTGEEAPGAFGARPAVLLAPFLPGGGVRAQEKRHPRAPYPLGGRSSKFTAATRQLLVDWAMLRQGRLKLGNDVLHLAVELADSLLASVVSPPPLVEFDACARARFCLIPEADSLPADSLRDPTSS